MRERAIEALARPWTAAWLCGLAGTALAQPPTARIEGVVLDSHSRPVANAAVTVAAAGTPLAATRSDGSGAFVLARLPSQRLVVRATTATPDVGAAAVDLQVEPRGFVRLRLMPARTVSGKVEDDAGRAIAGAWVATVPTGDAAFGCLATHALTDAEGRFTFPHVPFGRNAVRAWAADHAGAAAAVDGVADAAIPLRLARDDVQERQFELLDGTAEQCAEARLSLAAFAEGAELPLPEAVWHPARGDDGRWHALGWPDEDAMQAHVDLAAAFVEPVVMHIDGGAQTSRKRFYVIADDELWVRGSILDDAGQPCADLPLLAFERESGNRALGTTAADGSFALRSPVPRGTTFQLRCLDPRFVLRHAQPRPRHVREPLRAELLCKHSPAKVQQFLRLPAVAVRCLLVDADGQPCAGADVVLLSEHRQQVTVAMDGGIPVVRHDAAVYARAASRRDGTVEFTGLDLTEGEGVVLQVAGPAGFCEQPFVVTGAAVQDLGRLRPGPAATVRGWVLDADGRPRAGARLHVQNWSGGERCHLVVSDRDGTFTLGGLMPGHCRIRELGVRLPGQLAMATAGETTEVVLR